jgi:hypothetical protein
MNETLHGVWVGGVIGVVGSVVTAVAAHILTTRKERKDSLRSKCEDLYKQTLALKIWNDKASHSSLKAWRGIVKREEPPEKDPDWDDDCPINSIGMIVELYFPDLASGYSKLLKLENRFRHGMYEYLVRTTGTRHDVVNLEEFLQAPQDAVDKELTVFKKQLAELARRL